MNTRVISTVFATAVLVSLASCGESEDRSINSTNLPSTKLYAVYEIYADASEQVFFQAQLTADKAPSDNRDDDTFVRLVDGDELWASYSTSISNASVGEDLFTDTEVFADNHVQLASGGFNFFFFSDIYYAENWYSAQLEYMGDQPYYMTMERANGNPIDKSFVTLPAPFTIAALTDTNISRSTDALIIDWQPVENDVEINIEILMSCPDGFSDHITRKLDTDEGSVTLNAGDLYFDTLTGSCSATANIIKTRLGTLDSRYIGGNISGHQHRSIVFNTSD